MRSTKKVFVFLVWLFLFLVPYLYSCAPQIQRTSVEGLSSVLKDQDVVIVDVRSDRDWNASDKKIKGALRGDPFHVESWADSLPKDKTIILYCA
jgi:rhodanese-related sulfurtransferase